MATLFVSHISITRTDIRWLFYLLRFLRWSCLVSTVPRFDFLAFPLGCTLPTRTSSVKANRCSRVGVSHTHTATHAQARRKPEHRNRQRTNDIVRPLGHPLRNRKSFSGYGSGKLASPFPWHLYPFAHRVTTGAGNSCVRACVCSRILVSVKVLNYSDGHSPGALWCTPKAPPARGCRWFRWMPRIVEFAVLSCMLSLSLSLSFSLSLVDPTVWRKIVPTDKALRSRVNYVTTLITPEHTYTHRREIDPRTECGVFAIFFEHSYPHHRAHPRFLAGNYRLNRCCNQCSVRFVFC